MEKVSIYQISNSIEEKCWRLLTQLLGQYDIQDMEDPFGDYSCLFGNTFKELFDDNFFQELIELSALFRASLDINDIAVPEDIAKVGILKQNNSEKDLMFRDACNKIIHSKEYSINFSYSPGHPLSNGQNGYAQLKSEDFRTPIITTIGKQGKTGWVAEVNFIKFIDIAMCLQHIKTNTPGQNDIVETVNAGRKKDS